MSHTPDSNAEAVQSLTADAGVQLVAFARACKAAARAVALYPADHPNVATALGTVAKAALAATAGGPLTVAVAPDALTVDGRGLERPDAAVTEFAALLHAHQIGQLTIQPQTDAEIWRRFLAVVSVQPEQSRLRGGLARLWSAEGESQIEVRPIDFNELLRERIRGDRATWDRVVADCLEGDAGGTDEWSAELLDELVGPHGSLSDLVGAIHGRVAQSGGDNGPAVLGGMLRAVAEFVGQTQPGDQDAMLSAMAEATARLPVNSLAPLLKSARSGSRANLGRFIADLATRVKDGTIADVVVKEVRGGRGTTQALADAFYGLAPDPTRRADILDMARHSADEAAGTGESNESAGTVQWQQSEAYLLTYSDEKYVPIPYDEEMRRLNARAIDLDRDATDPPDRIAAWTATVDEAALRVLDAQMLIDLMRLQRDARRWRELADLAVARIDMLAVVGDYHTATLLVAAINDQAQHHGDPAVESAAANLLERMSTATLMRHLSTQLDTSDKQIILGAKQLCHALGTAIVGPLAEVLSREERLRPRQHLIDILLGLGSTGRAAVERLKESSNAAVRRTAVLLLREFGGTDALTDLESMLNDAEAHVQGDATHAIALMRSDAAYETLVRALAGGTDHARTVILGVLSTIPNEDALPALAFLVKNAPFRGPMWQVHERAIQRLGAIGGRPAIEALNGVLYKSLGWTPFKGPVLRRLVVDAIARIGSPEAVDALREAARHAPRGARAAARRHVAAAESRSRTRERHS